MIRIDPRSLIRGVLFALLTSLAAPAGGNAQEDVFSIDGLVITASPSALEEDAVAGHVTVLTGEILGRLGPRPLAEALRDVSGVDIVRSGSFGSLTSAFVRGGESDYTLVLVDGVQVNQAGGGFDFAELNTENVERVEILRGPASALYGSDAMTGVIHIITRTGRGAPRASVSWRGGSFGTVDVDADFQAGTDRAAFSAGISRTHSDGILPFNNDYSATVLSGKARLVPDAETEVSVSLRLTDREYHFPTDGSGAVVDSNAFNYSDMTTARISARRTLAAGFALEGSLAYNGTDGGTDDAQDAPSDSLGSWAFHSLDDFTRTKADVRALFEVDATTLTAGFEYENERQRSFSESDGEFGPSSGRSEAERSNLAYFVHAIGGWAGVSVSAGARLEDNQRYGRIGTWQVGATWRAERTGTVVRGSVGRGIKEPTFFETSASGFATGNPDLDPERSRSWEVGVEQPFASDRLRARATFFDESFRDLIQYTFAPPAPGDPNYYNVAEASARGVELDLTGTLGRVGARASWTWLDTEVVDAGFDEGAGAVFVEGEPLIRRPGHSASAGVDVDLAPVTVDLGFRYVGERSDRDYATFPAEPVTLAAYTTWSAGATWRVIPARGSRPGFSVQVRGENLFDTSYQEAVGFEAPGRGLYVGGRIELGG